MILITQLIVFILLVLSNCKISNYCNTLRIHLQFTSVLHRYLENCSKTFYLQKIIKIQMKKASGEGIKLVFIEEIVKQNIVNIFNH